MRLVPALFCGLLFAGTWFAAGIEPKFVAVGESGRRISSIDGITWENDSQWPADQRDDDGNLRDVTFGLGSFIAVGGSDTRGRILSTRDGRTWRNRPGTSRPVSAIAFGRGCFVAAEGNELLYSVGGEHFIPGAKLPWQGTVRPRRCVFGSGEGGSRFVLIGDYVDNAGEVKHWRAATEDGQTLVSAQLYPSGASALAYGAGHFVMVGPAGMIESSHDGHEWSRHSIEASEHLTGIVWDGARFVVSSESRTWFSADGMTWRSEPGPLPCAIAWAHHTIGAFGFAPSGEFLFSKNLRDWKKVALPPGPRLRALAAGHGLE